MNTPVTINQLLCTTWQARFHTTISFFTSITDIPVMQLTNDGPVAQRWQQLDCYLSSRMNFIAPFVVLAAAAVLVCFLCVGRYRYRWLIGVTVVVLIVSNFVFEYPVNNSTQNNPPGHLCTHTAAHIAAHGNQFEFLIDTQQARCLSATNTCKTAAYRYSNRHTSHSNHLI